MELRHLRYFVAIAEERSFTRAAERVWVAQPGLSSQIRRLEDELGIKLFERHTRGVDLTGAGEVFLERARSTLAAADEARATGADLEAGLLGSIRLGVAACAQWSGLSPLLGRFATSHPGVELTVVEAYGGTLLRDLRDGRLDALVAPAAFGSAEFARLRLGLEPWIVLVGGGHRLASHAPISADEVAGERVVITGHRDGAGYDREVMETLEALGVRPRVLRGGPGPALFAPVADGTALALSTAGRSEGNGIVGRALLPAPELTFQLFWRDGLPTPALVELIRAAEGAAQVRPGPLAPPRSPHESFPHTPPVDGHSNA
jgi:DNA-binding transcriptional LysR family regulator